MKKLKNYLRIPCKSSSDTADLQTKLQTLRYKRAPAQDIYLFNKFLCLLFSISSKKCAFHKQVFSQIRQKHLFRVN